MNICKPNFFNYMNDKEVHVISNFNPTKVRRLYVIWLILLSIEWHINNKKFSSTEASIICKVNSVPQTKLTTIKLHVTTVSLKRKYNSTVQPFHNLSRKSRKSNHPEIFLLPKHTASYQFIYFSIHLIDSYIINTSLFTFLYTWLTVT